MKLIFTTLAFIVAATYLAQAGEKKQTLAEYSAAEATKHIGETARVTDQVSEVSARHWGGVHSGLGERDAKGNPQLYAITYSDVIPGPKLDLYRLKKTVITVTGKIKEYGHTGFVSIDVKSTSQIVPHRQ